MNLIKNRSMIRKRISGEVSDAGYESKALVDRVTETEKTSGNSAYLLRFQAVI